MSMVLKFVGLHLLTLPICGGESNKKSQEKKKRVFYIDISLKLKEIL